MAGMAGSGPGHLNQPTDVITAPNGDIFVADGHNGQSQDPPAGSTGRILKYTSDGTFVREWGQIGNGIGEFRTPHALEFDSRGRLFVADRATTGFRSSTRTATTSTRTISSAGSAACT